MPIISTPSFTLANTANNPSALLSHASIPLHSEPIALILMAAGSSSRFISKKQPIKKQWLRIHDMPLWLAIAHTLSSVYPFVHVYITANSDEVSYMQSLCSYSIIEGGASRQESLRNALAHVKAPWVLVSDVARPGILHIATSMLASLINALHPSKQADKNIHTAQALQQANPHTSPAPNTSNLAPHMHIASDDIHSSLIDCVAPALTTPDTIYCAKRQCFLERSTLYRIQTPQLSRTSALKEAITHVEGTDESSILHAYGKHVCYIPGSLALEKLTNPSDITFMASLLTHALPSMPITTHAINTPTNAYANPSSIYVGSGFDVHGFEEGKIMKLGGVTISSPIGFKAHSDGDVALHSIIDAILGAIGGFDIGEWFPDSSDTWKNADSSKLLARVWGFARSIGYELCNLDLTIIAQTPTISPYKRKIREHIATLLHAPLHAINVKATTTEHLGFVGRKEGVCALSSISLRLVSITESASLTHSMTL